MQDPSIEVGTIPVVARLQNCCRKGNGKEKEKQSTCVEHIIILLLTRKMSCFREFLENQSFLL